jgi:hypothetical protein
VEIMQSVFLLQAQRIKTRIEEFGEKNKVTYENDFKKLLIQIVQKDIISKIPTETTETSKQNITQKYIDILHSNPDETLLKQIDALPSRDIIKNTSRDAKLIRIILNNIQPEIHGNIDDIFYKVNASNYVLLSGIVQKQIDEDTNNIRITNAVTYKFFKEKMDALYEELKLHLKLYTSDEFKHIITYATSIPITLENKQILSVIDVLHDVWLNDYVPMYNSLINKLATGIDEKPISYPDQQSQNKVQHEFTQYMNDELKRISRIKVKILIDNTCYDIVESMARLQPAVDIANFKREYESAKSNGAFKTIYDNHVEKILTDAVIPSSHPGGSRQKKQSTTKPKVHVLGRQRVIHIIKRNGCREMVTYNGAFITIEKAFKLEKRYHSRK